MSNHWREPNDWFDLYNTVDVPGLTEIINRVRPWQDRTASVHVEVTVDAERGYQLAAYPPPEKVQQVRDIIETSHVLEFLHTFNPEVCRQILEKLANTDKKLTAATEEIGMLP